MAYRRKEGKAVAQGGYKLYTGKNFTRGRQSNSGQAWDLNLNFFLHCWSRIHCQRPPWSWPSGESRGLHRNSAALNSTLCSPVILWKDGMFWKPHSPAKHFFPCWNVLATPISWPESRPGLQEMLTCSLLTGRRLSSSLLGSPCSGQSLQEKASTCPGVGQKAGRPEKENPAFCLHVPIPNVCDSFQMQTENLTNFAFLSKLSPFKFLHINSDENWHRVFCKRKHSDCQAWRKSYEKWYTAVVGFSVFVMGLMMKTQACWAGLLPGYY